MIFEGIKFHLYNWLVADCWDVLLVLDVKWIITITPISRLVGYVPQIGEINQLT